MADRYDVTIHFTAEDSQKPNVDPDHETTVVWRDMPYVSLVELEKLLIGTLQQTTSWGDAVVQQGSGKK